MNFIGPKSVWLAVQVTKGMFPSERIVKVRTNDGEVSLFVAQRHLESAKTGVDRLRVELLDMDENYGLVEVTAQRGPTIVKVQRDDLADAA
jgi:hypothetical protein